MQSTTYTDRHIRAPRTAWNAGANVSKRASKFLVENRQKWLSGYWGTVNTDRLQRSETQRFFLIFEIRDSPCLLAGRTWGRMSETREQSTKTSTRRPALVYSLRRTEVLQATLKHSAHVTSYGLLSCNQCEVLSSFPGCSRSLESDRVPRNCR